MKKILLASFAAFALFSSLKAQVSLPYVTGFDNAGQQAGWQQFRKGVNSQFQEWEFDNAQAFSAPTSLVHYYPVGGTDPMDDWFVSPAFEIPSGGMLDSVRYYFSGFGTPAAGDTVFIYLLTGNPDPDLASKMILFEFSGLDYINDNTWRKLEPIELPSAPGNSYLAFRYRTVNNWLDVRFDNVAISGTSSAGISEQEYNTVTLFPNPANGQVRLQFSEAVPAGSLATLVLYNTAGQRVHTVEVSGNKVVDLPIAAGFYTYQLLGLPTGTIAGKLVVE